MSGTGDQSAESPLRAAQNQFVDAVPLRALRQVRVPLMDAVDRVVGEDVLAPTDMPPYPRAIVEGYLVHAAETEGASEAAPKRFKIVGRVEPGDPVCPPLGPGQAIEVVTGSLVHGGPVAIARMWEAKRNGDEVSVARPFPPHFFIEQQGCDLKKGAVCVAAGTRLGPWELALLAGAGIGEVPVVERPRVAIFSCGNEVIPHTESLTPGAIWDCNSIMLSAAVTNAGGVPRFVGIMRDDFDAFLSQLRAMLGSNDMVVISGGTAAAGRDFISDLIRAVGTLVVDGVPMRSGRPLIMGVADGKPIVCVAGHPPEALRGFRLFGALAMNRLLGRTVPIPDDTPPTK